MTPTIPIAPETAAFAIVVGALIVAATIAVAVLGGFRANIAADRHRLYSRGFRRPPARRF